MSLNLVTNIWLAVAPILLISGWWLTKNSQPDSYRVVLQSLIIAVACGFSGFGADHGSGSLVPWWFFATPEFSFMGILLLLIWWVVVSIVYLFLYKKIKETNSNWNKK